jgi:excisionase family DNA binding protein
VGSPVWGRCPASEVNDGAGPENPDPLTLRSLNPTITARPSEQLPLGSWLFIPKRRAAANADISTTSLPAGFYTPETLAAYLGVSTSTIYSWNSSGYGPPFVKLGNLVRYTYEDVELWLARQLELSRG